MDPTEVADALRGTDQQGLPGVLDQARSAGYDAPPADSITPGIGQHLLGMGLPTISFVLGGTGQVEDVAIIP